MNYLKKLKWNKYVCYIILTLFVLIRFKQGYILNGADQSYPLSFQKEVATFSTLWNDNVGYGELDTRSGGKWIHFLFFSSLEKLGIDSESVQKIYYLIPVIVSLLSADYLASTIYKLLYSQENQFRQKNKDFFCIIFSFFWLLNPYSLIFIWSKYISVFIYSIIPLIIALVINISIDKKYITISKILLFFLVGIYSSLSNINPVMLSVILWGYFLLLLLVLFFLEFKNAIFILLRTSLFWLFFFLGSAYWILPIILNFQNEVIKAYSNTSKHPLDLYIEFTRSATVLNLIRLIGMWNIFDGFRGDDYYVWNWIYKNILGNIGLLLLPFSLFYFLFYYFINNKNSKNFVYIIFFIIYFIIAIFFQSGQKSPYPEINFYLFGKIGFFSIYRQVTEKLGFVPILLYCISLNYL